MRIRQCHVSKSVHDFPFTRLYGLDNYNDSLAPCVFFGCYNDEDLKAILHHKDLAVIWWCGQDAKDFKDWHLFGPNVKHVTERLKVYEHVKSLGVDIKLLPCSNLAERCEVSPLGNKIFAYCPMSYPEYHGIDIINELKARLPYEFMIGDGSIPQPEWRAGKCEPFYKDCFIGLVLSPFAGGGASVIELGLRGRKCITNVIELGNVIRWETTEDIIKAIVSESNNIGFTQHDVAIQTLQSMDLTNKFLNTDEYN